MPADDIVAKVIPAIGVVALAGRARDSGRNVVPVVNQLEAQLDQLGILDGSRRPGPASSFTSTTHGEGVTVFLGVPVAQPPPGLPAPAHYRVLPEIEAAVAVRSGPSASIYPMVYQDLLRWIKEHGYRPLPGPGRDVWIHEIDDIADVDQQVFEVQLPFNRQEGAGGDYAALRPEGSPTGARRRAGTRR